MTTPKTDRELLELAAKAAGHEFSRSSGEAISSDGRCAWIRPGIYWQPFDDDGDALWLAVKLKIRIGFRPCAYADTPAGLRFFGARDGDDQFSRTRLAIVRAAAEIGRTL